MDIFVKRPVISLVIALVLLLSGIMAAKKIAVLQFPQVESTSLVITTRFEGSSAAVVQGFITDPVERVAMTIPGVDFVDSKTSAGMSTVTVWLKLNEDSSAALAELTSQLNQIRSEFPAAAEDPSVTLQRADRAGAVFYLSVDGGSKSRAEVTDYLNRRVNPKMATITGVQRIGLHGQRDPAMRVWLDPVKLAALNMPASQIWTALEANNVIATLGKTENHRQQINLLSNATLKTPEDFARLVVRKDGNAVIRLGDVARIELGEDTGSETTRNNQQQVVFIAIWPQPGANEIRIGDELYPMLDAINSNLPDGMHIGIGYDGTKYMRAALLEIFTTLLETIVLVGIVVLALMGSLRTALVPLATIPLSILGAVAVIWVMGYTLNLLTILAIVLSVGLVVDDAIVVVENVARHMQQGRSRLDAALKSSRELLSPIVAMTLTLAAVYAPIGFVSGLTGSLFREFAFTLAVAVIISGLVAITLSPVMSAWVNPERGREGKLTRRVNGYFDRLRTGYDRALNRVFDWKAQLLTAALLLSLLMVPFYLFSSKELAPVEDEGGIMMIVEAPAAASIDYTNQYMDVVVSSLEGLDGKTDIWQVLNPSNGFGGIEFVDYSDRSRSVQEMLPEVYQTLSGISGLRVFPVLPPALPTAGQFDVELVVQGPDDYLTMAEYAGKLIGAAYGSGQFMFASTDLKVDLLQARLVFDSDRMADLGLDMNSVNAQLNAMNSEQFVNRFDLRGKAYRVISQLDSDDRSEPEALMDLSLVNPDGDWIPLRAIARLEREVSPRALGKFNQQRAFRIMGGIVPGVTSDMALATLEKAAAEILPEGYSIDYAGISRQLRTEGSSMMSVLLMALAVVYLLLSVQFNSFRLPLVVLAGSVPLALSGALMLSFLGLTTLNIYAQIGLITLVALVAKNGILITEFANELQKKGLSKLDAIRQSAQTRLRPVLMTTMATVFGHFPLVLVTGAGAEARNSIGIILVGGMLIGTLFTLFVLPCVYLWLGKEHTVEPEHLPELVEQAA
ncbi:MAG: efflux RND transporter permease subunit [Endozoicomonas sp.]